MKPGDVILRVPDDYRGLVRFGYYNHAFLRFCSNHAKPFGFRWQYESKHCPKCGDCFVEDATRTFVMITNGYTFTQAFQNGVQVYPASIQVDAAEWPEFIG